MSTTAPRPSKPLSEEPEPARLPDGTALRLRRLQGADEPLLHDLARHMTREDLVGLRFFTPVRDLSPPLAARLSHLRGDRQLAILAETGDGETALGVARFAAEPEASRAEFAIAVRSDWKGRGLGVLLLMRLITAARAMGLATLFGDVLRENAPMLRLGRRLGFTVTRHPDDSALLRLTLAL